MASTKSPDDPWKDLLPGSASSPESPPDPNGEMTTDERRRRLIRGMAAVAPMVLTLQSGAARAAQSNYRCIGELADLPREDGNLHLVSNSVQACSSDRYQREFGQSGYSVTIGSDGEAETYLLFDYGGKEGPENWIDQYGTPWEKQSDANSFRRRTGDSEDQYYPGSATSLDLAVFVDNDGNVALFPEKGEGMSPISCSCWSSFDPRGEPFQKFEE